MINKIRKWRLLRALGRGDFEKVISLSKLKDEDKQELRKRLRELQMYKWMSRNERILYGE